MSTSIDDIRNLLATYCVLLDQDRIDECAALFTPDSVYQVFGRDWVGPAGVHKMLVRAPGGLHLGGQPVIAIDGDRARSTQNVLFMDRTDGAIRGALYDDELVRTDEGWRIKSRRCRFVTATGLADRPDR